MEQPDIGGMMGQLEIGGNSTQLNNEDGSVEITSFTDIQENVTLHFQIIRLPKQNNTVSVSSIFGGTSDNTGSSIARRLGNGREEAAREADQFGLHKAEIERILVAQYRYREAHTIKGFLLYDL
ncbi:hypothetical protein V2J09_013879 [Rumex salicifolius]